MIRPTSIASGSVRRFVNRMLSLSYVELAGVYFLGILISGVAYFLLSVFVPEHAPTIAKKGLLEEFYNAIYFSTITATSVGYGDIVPQGFSKLITAMESFFALFVFGILVAKPISEREEAALYQVHKLTLENIFNTIREGFFIVRKDFDAIINAAKEGRLTEQSMENLETALKHSHVLLEDIPTFYDTERRLYVIDRRREHLLAESVERTFERMEILMMTLDEVQSPWRRRAEIHLSLQELSEIMTKIIRHWQRHASKHVHSPLKRLQEKAERLATLI